jgi:acyl-CoA dehydrogenase
METKPKPSEAEAIFPQLFLGPQQSPAAQIYLSNAITQKLLQFFQEKGLTALKDEDRREQWYDDWLAYQAKHRLYAQLLSPKAYSTLGAEFNLLKLTRFVEVFAYCSPSHGYSFQVSFLGIFSILMGSNEELKREAVATLEAGGLFAFGVSEKDHGSDLMANEFTITEISPSRFAANGSKYYIGNANCAAIISILARKIDKKTAERPNRAPLVLLALRPSQSKGFKNLRKIHTLGVRAAFVGEFEVKDHELPETDLIAQGRKAWDAVFGAITLGKFFLGFGQIGICEHAWEEAVAHLSRRVLFGSPAIQMPHLMSAMSQAYTRLTAMKLYAYRALDYVQSSRATDRRYMLFTAVQKAKVSTDGVKFMALLSECIGAKGFESDTFFEMALRDVPLIRSLEGSAHVNLALTAQFIPAYFSNFDSAAAAPKSMFSGELAATENPFLMEASTHGINTIRFPQFLQAYRPLISIPNIRSFAKQAIAFSLFVRHAQDLLLADNETSLALGGCLATITYGQLIAENSVLLGVSEPIISAIFHILVRDLSDLAITIATLPQLNEAERIRIRRLVIVPQPRGSDWDFVAQRISGRPVET